MLFPIKSALFVDYDNIRPLAAPLSKNVVNWYDWLEAGNFDGLGRRKFTHKAAYWHPVNAGQEAIFQRLGFKTKTCVYTAGSKREQSAVDLHLAIDVVQLACSPNRPKEIVILASDSDYFPIIELLKEKQIRSVIIVSGRDASHNYQGVADAVISADDLVEACDYVKPKPWYWFRRGKPKQQPDADPAYVADAVAKAALALDAPLYMGPVLRILKDVPGFSKSGPDAYFGFGSLNKLARDIVRRRPELEMWRGRRGLVIAPRERGGAIAQGG